MAESRLNPPPTLNLTEGNISENFRKWKRLLEIYLIASGAKTKPKDQQVAIILHCAGQQTIEVSDQFIYEEGEEANPDILINKLEEYCNPRNNEVLETYRFWKMRASHPFDGFLTELRTQADKCKFKDKDRMLRDKIVFASEKSVQEKLLRYSDLTLKKNHRNMPSI